MGKFYRKYGKRAFDLLASATGLMVCSVPLGVVSLLLLIGSGPPLLFRQRRVGRGGKHFDVLKFRTMRIDAEKEGTVTLDGDRRITPLGRLLRKTKLDELPQIWNVLVGDMSFVGPRPDVPEYMNRLRGEEMKILSVRPGITGPATLAYRNEEEILAQADNPVEYNDCVIFPDKVKINMEYCDRYSLALDLYYILATLIPPLEGK